MKAVKTYTDPITDADLLEVGVSRHSKQVKIGPNQYKGVPVPSLFARYDLQDGEGIQVLFIPISETQWTPTQVLSASVSQVRKVMSAALAAKYGVQDNV